MKLAFVCTTSIRASYAKGLERLANPSTLRTLSPKEPYLWILGTELQFQAKTLFHTQPTDLLLATVAKILSSELVQREAIELLFIEGPPTFERLAIVIESLLKAAQGLLSLSTKQSAA